MERKLFYSILKFELMHQIRTRTFWLVSLIPPIAMILMFIVNNNSRHVDSVLVNNQTSLFQPIESSETMQVKYGVNREWREEGYNVYICLTQDDVGKVICEIFSTRVLSPATQNTIKDELETKLAESYLGINIAKVKAQESDNIKIKTQIENPRYKLQSLSIIAVFLVYIIVLQFASSILRITGREKMNKICEILVSAMPTHIIMSGKLIACLIAAFLQMIMWCVIGLLLMLVLGWTQNSNYYIFETLLQIAFSIPKGELIEFIFMYLLYLIGGFLLYCIMFSILGAISNENTNTQQFSLVVTMPLLITYIYVIRNFGESTNLLTCLSFIPFSSPIAALPIVADNGITFQVVVSLLILYATIFIMFYYACILYKAGVLAGKSKVTIKTIIHWL